MFLHQIDIIEQLKNIVVLSTVLDEVRNKSIALYTRVRTLISDPDRRIVVFSNEHHKNTYVQKAKNESINDRNDRAIRVAAKFYMNHAKCNIVLVTDDAENKRLAGVDGINAQSVREYVFQQKHLPHLADLIAVVDDSEIADKKFSYPEVRSC